MVAKRFGVEFYTIIHHWFGEYRQETFPVVLEIDAFIIFRCDWYFAVCENWPFKMLHHMCEHWGHRASPHNLVLSLSSGARSWGCSLKTRRDVQFTTPAAFFLCGSVSVHVITLQRRWCSSATDLILDCCQLCGKIRPISLFSVFDCIFVSHWLAELNSNHVEAVGMVPVAFKGKAWHFGIKVFLKI